MNLIIFWLKDFELITQPLCGPAAFPSNEGFCWVTELETAPKVTPRSDFCAISTLDFWDFLALLCVLKMAPINISIKNQLGFTINEWMPSSDLVVSFLLFLLNTFLSSGVYLRVRARVCMHYSSSDTKNHPHFKPAGMHRLAQPHAPLDRPSSHVTLRSSPLLWTWLTTAFPKQSPWGVKGNSVTGSHVADPWEW